jgi:hypothetical protein
MYFGISFCLFGRISVYDSDDFLQTKSFIVNRFLSGCSMNCFVPVIPYFLCNEIICKMSLTSHWGVG